MHEKHPYNSDNKNEPNPQEPSHEAGQHPSPAIYVASLADYNNGILHGAWIDAAREPEEIQADIDAMLAKSLEPEAEEFVIFDYDHFGLCRINEHDPIDVVARVARGIKEHGNAFAAWVDVYEKDPGSWDDFSEAYLGHYNSVQDYADRLADELGYAEQLDKVPESLQPYIRFDCEALARDMELSGDIYTVRDPAGGVWIFRTDT